jgi:hypothetical protein
MERVVLPEDLWAAERYKYDMGFLFYHREQEEHRVSEYRFPTIKYHLQSS